MSFKIKSKLQRRISVLVSCVLTALIVINISVPALSVGDDAGNGTAGGSITLEYLEPSGEAAVASALYFDAAPAAEVDDNALKLEYGENIIKMVISYLVGDNWVEITDKNASGLPADTNYQFEFTYSNISIDDLLTANGQMIYEGLPDWFTPAGIGALLHEGEKVATIEAADGKICILFDTDWLKKLEEEGSRLLSGTFKVSGTIDWHKLPPDGSDVKLPDMDLTMHFEDNLAQKYGNLDIEKSEPELVRNDATGKYYLKYELKVTSLEDVAMTGVTVKDLFSDAAYIAGYVGITNGLHADGYEPAEDSSIEDFTEGSWYVNGKYMLWDIGTLEPNEERTLTYYAEIAEDYIERVISNPIQNRAEVYTKTEPNGDEYLKDTDSSSFAPRNDIDISKKSDDALLDNNGTGTISYTITISASEENSFVLDNITLNDSFPEYLKNYLSGDNGGNSLTVTVTKDGESKTQTLNYNDASFDLSGLELEPGGEITITYTVSVKNIFFYNNGDVELTNTAILSKGGRTLSGTENTEALEKHTWVRKVAGDPVKGDMVVEIPQGDDVYEYSGEQIVKDNEPPGDFTVKDGSVKYQIVVNENGLWDISSATLTDEFSDSEHLKHAGYIQIQLYERSGDSSGDITDSAMINELEKSNPVRTIWLKADGSGRFSFEPEKLGIEGNYAYLLTYYAEPDNMEEVGSITISNSFNIQGKVGIGDGGYVNVPGIDVSVGKVLKGDANYEAEKSSWYYEPYPVYRKPELDGIYPESTVNNDYQYGAIYWVIRLEGNIREGYMDEKDKSLSGFYIKDTPDSQVWLRRDSVMGVYLGSKNLNLNDYSSFEDFVSKHPWKEQLTGNPQNDKYFGQTAVSDAEYQWSAEETKLNGIVFPEGLKLGDDEAVYIVLRTAARTAMPGDNIARTYSNTLAAQSGDKSFNINTAYYTYIHRTSLMKESKGAYTYDAETGEFTNCSNKTGGDWNVDTLVDKSMLTTGTYATWLLNVNWNGSMEGTADIVDYLPPGMELVYVDVNNIGRLAAVGDVDNWPHTVYINELSGNGDWVEMIKDCTINGQNVSTISYYNKSTGEIRWRICNLSKNTTGLQTHAINLRIICRVTDPELFLNSGSKTYVNNAAVWDDVNSQPVDMESADVTITKNFGKYLDEDALRALEGSMSGNKITGSYNRIPFRIEINPVGEDMVEGSTLPPLIDELDGCMRLVEDSIVITAGGAPYTGFTYSLDEENGKQRFIIYGLPDGVPITITYQARVDTIPNNPVEISNTAYWAGYDPPDTPQVSGSTFEYKPSGDVFTNYHAGVEITKVDADSHSKKLSGAEFELYKVNADGSLELIGGPKASDSMGKVTFGGEDEPGLLEYNTVYCIREKTAPNGYKTDDTPHYFVIIDPNTGTPDFAEYGDINPDIWYESPQYGITIENSKGEIGAEKVFIDENGGEYTPDSGTYRFGLFDYAGRLLETLTIEYTVNGPKYFLDDMPKENPVFTKFDPEGVYRIYELDEHGNPITEGNMSEINGVTYLVTYSTEQVTVNNTVRITNRMVLVDLPAAGGIGPIGYCLSGSLLMLIFLLYYSFLRRGMTM